MNQTNFNVEVAYAVIEVLLTDEPLTVGELKTYLPFAGANVMNTVATLCSSGMLLKKEKSSGGLATYFVNKELCAYELVKIAELGVDLSQFSALKIDLKEKKAAIALSNHKEKLKELEQKELEEKMARLPKQEFVRDAVLENLEAVFDATAQALRDVGGLFGKSHEITIGLKASYKKAEEELKKYKASLQHKRTNQYDDFKED